MNHTLNEPAWEKKHRMRRGHRNRIAGAVVARARAWPRIALGAR